MKAKLVSESRVTLQYQVMPAQVNNSGKMHGGELLRMLDSAGAICAFRHARTTLVTAAIEHMEFIAPIQPGDIIMFHCSVNAVRRTSMEVGVRIEAEECRTGVVRHVSTGYLTFVAVDKEGKPMPLPPLEAETDEDRRRMADAARRMAISRMGRQQTKSLVYYFRLEELDEHFALCTLPKDAPLPQVPATAILATVRSEEGLFLALSARALSTIDSSSMTVASTEYVCFMITDDLDHTSVGVVASISAILTSARISVHLLSTLDTNFVLVPAKDRETAILALEAVGHCISRRPCFLQQS